MPGPPGSEGRIGGAPALPEPGPSRGWPPSNPTEVEQTLMRRFVIWPCGEYGNLAQLALSASRPPAKILHGPRIGCVWRSIGARNRKASGLTPIDPFSGLSTIVRMPENDCSLSENDCSICENDRPHV